MNPPKYDKFDVVKFDAELLGDGTKTFEGYIAIVDRYGTFEQNEEPSYDVYVPDMNTLFKHIREHSVEFIRKPRKSELNKWNKEF